MCIVSVNNDRIAGRIKPVHSVVGVLSTSVRTEIKWNGNSYRHVSELGMPYSRFNGIGGNFGAMLFVDVCNIFRDPDADEFDGNNYDFTFTDWLVKECVSRGVKPIYRLGVCKEPDHRLKAYNIYPPKDYGKFARICERIILHYNSGWNGGYDSDIRYWEIWDGPDNARKAEDNACWKGTKEDYFEFYRVVAGHLKNRFPSLLFGGYGASGFDLNDNDCYQTEFFRDFLKYITAEKTKSPLDFFTWNSVSQDPDINAETAQYVRGSLDGAGLTECENICGSWNSGIADPSEIKSASVIGANLIAWQNSAADKATYDNCNIGAPYGLFGIRANATSVASYGYYVMKAFNALYKLGFQTESISDDKDVRVLSASCAERSGLMIVNRSDGEKNVEIKTVGVNKNTVTVTVIKKVDTAHLSAEEVKGLFMPRKASGVLKFTITPHEVRLYEFT
ncbi:MAG: hypothetical protein J5697_02355 [Clostridia bacterium]|nr:hypothetical protein [Clostridia bacterium]